MLKEETDLGFGTEYEKIIFSKIVHRMREKYRINSYYNYPKNHLLGKTEEITGPIAETKEKPDLLWNFCEFENESQTENFLSELQVFKPKHILIVTQNKLNPGTLIHYLYHKVFGKAWDHGYLSKMTIKPIKQFTKKNRTYEILEIGTFDAPWFILDVYETGRYLKKLIPKSNRSSQSMKPSFFEHSPKIIKKWASHHNYILLRLSS